MSPRRGDAVAPPPTGAEWAIHFATNEAAKSWDELVRTAPNNVRRAWDIMRADPGPGPGKPTSRHHQLKGPLAYATHKGHTLPQWQIEVTGSGRIWYLFDEKSGTVWIQHTGTAHPRATD